MIRGWPCAQPNACNAREAHAREEIGIDRAACTRTSCTRESDASAGPNEYATECPWAENVQAVACAQE